MFTWFRSLFKQQEAISALGQRVDKVEHDWKRVEAEWNDWFDRFRRLHMKLSKREQREANGLATSEAAPAEGGADVPAPLTARQRLINMQVAERRKRMGGG